jgi:hypothetical protein
MRIFLLAAFSLASYLMILHNNQIDLCRIVLSLNTFWDVRSSNMGKFDILCPGIPYGISLIHTEANILVLLN